MKRRDWLTATGALAGATALGRIDAIAAAEQEPSRVEHRRARWAWPEWTQSTIQAIG
jgi:hypothetical protein